MFLQKKGPTLLLAAALPLFLAACEGDDGAPGPAGGTGAVGAQGVPGADGANSLVVQTELAVGNAQCRSGGVQFDSGLDTNGNGSLDANEITDTTFVCNASADRAFVRVATFPVCSLIDPDCDDVTETAAEIVAATPDGRTLIYTDSPTEQLGFVDISDPANPVGIEAIALGGEPTSVAVSGNRAFVGVVDPVNTFDIPAGFLAVVDTATRTISATVNVGGQPDSIAVSPDGNWLAIVIENERDEDENDGDIGATPQLPAGFVWVVDISGGGVGTPIAVTMTGLASTAPSDPEPEYVDINDDNIAVVTLQENNHIVLIDLESQTIINDFNAGTVDLAQIDLTEDGDDPTGRNRIFQTEMQMAIPREADGVAWISNELFATADEGDYLGGSRGFTIYNTSGEVVYTSGNNLDHLAARYGHYNDERSGNKGNEPENAEYGNYDGDDILVIASERSSLLFVYDVSDPVRPMLTQTLPTALGPEGVLAIPSRNLLVAASEEDSRDDKFRGGLNIYTYAVQDPTYPTIASADRMDGTPIPWSAMSGLGYDAVVPGYVFSIEDSFYGSNRIFRIDPSTFPATLDREITIVDTNDVFAGITVDAVTAGTADDDPTRIDVFDSEDLAAMINADKTVNIDPEGIDVAGDGGFWIASEGAGTVGDAARPVNSANLIFKTDASGLIEAVVQLPDAVDANQLRFGFEGIAEYNDAGWVAFQRVWPGDTNVRIGRYDLTAASWSFFFYPLEAPISPNGGWVGLSDLTSLDDGRFLVVERDNQGGPDARIKRLYVVDTNGAVDGDTLTKTLVADLIPSLEMTGGPIPEKVEGSVVVGGDVWIINDNDGVDDNSGETQFLNLGAILP
ncbi:MAG: esterase-like activity of phytase family protein [Pseudomonadota bacterium]